MPAATPGAPACIGVVLEPDRTNLSQELLGAGVALAADLPATVVALDLDGRVEARELSTWGVHSLLRRPRGAIEEDVAYAIAARGSGRAPMGRVRARHGVGPRGRVPRRRCTRRRTGRRRDRAGGRRRPLVVWKLRSADDSWRRSQPSHQSQLATPGAGALPRLHPRIRTELDGGVLEVEARSRVRGLARERDAPATATTVVGVGRAVPVEETVDSKSCWVLRAELGATRKVSDVGRLLRALKRTLPAIRR